jgi:hypothetical protein
LETYEIEWLCTFSQEQETWNLHNLSFRCKDEIWFIPSTNGEYIAVYNTMKHSVEYVELPSCSHMCKTSKFLSVMEWNGAFWLIPAGYALLIEIYPETRKMNVYDNWPSDVCWETETDVPFFDSFVYKGEIWMWEHDKNRFIIFDVDRHLFRKQIFTDLDKSDTYRACLWNNNVILFSDQAKEVFFCNIEKGGIIKVVDLQKIQEDAGICGATLCYGKYFYAFPFQGTKIYRIDLENYEIDVVTMQTADGESNFRYMTNLTINDQPCICSDNENLPLIKVEEEGKMTTFQWNWTTKGEIKKLIGMIEQQDRK